MEKREIKMYFKQIYAKNCQTAFEKVIAMATACLVRNQATPHCFPR